MQFDWSESEEYVEEEHPHRSALWRILYVILLVIALLALILTQTGLAQLIFLGGVNEGTLVGRTEAEIINRLGIPDYQSAIQYYEPGEGFGPLPQSLESGDPYYFLNYTIGPRVYVFHLVSPETFTKHTGQLVLGDEWVVLEVASRSRFVVF
jgi:hypothetical protein